MVGNWKKNSCENLQPMRNQKKIDTKVEFGMKNFVITIGREFGSGGHKLGQYLAEKLGIPCYDRHLIDEAAERGGFKTEELEDADEMKANRFLFKVPAKCNPFTGYGKPMNDTLFVVQSQLIREYAKKGPCIIVGRCADKVLEGTEGLVSLFIYAPMEARVKEIMRRYETDEKEAEYLIKQADKIRKNYYNFYAKKTWADKASYDMLIDGSRISGKELAAMLRALLKERGVELEKVGNENQQEK